MTTEHDLKRAKKKIFLKLILHVLGKWKTVPNVKVSKNN